MNENKNLQPEVSPEEHLDQLLAQFMSEPDLEVPDPVDLPEADLSFLDAIIPEQIAENTSVTEALPEAALAEEMIPEEITPVEEEVLEETPICDQIPVEAAEVPAAEQLPLPLEEAAEAAPQESDPAEDMPLLIPIEDAEQTQIEAFEDTWIGELMDVPMVTEEIGADESAVAAAGLVHPEDQEFVDILQEAQDAQEAEEMVAIAAESEAEAVPADEEVPPMADETPEAKEQEPMVPTPPAEAAPVQEEAAPRTIRKIRPKRKDSYGFFSLPHMAAVAIWLAIILFIGVSLGNILWEYASDMLAFGRPTSTVTITINETDDLDIICDKLQATGLIKYPSLFKLYANLSDAMEGINPGTYKLSTQFDYNALVDAMSGIATRVSINVTIPEGYNCAQLFQLLENKGVCTVAAMEAAVANVNAEDYWFLEGVDQENPYWLEGYLFPDTYKFYLNHSPEGVLSKLLSNFDKRLTESMRNKLPVLNDRLAEMMRNNGLSESYISSHQLTMRDIVIIASMIEKEAANTTEGYMIASVIYNRLTNPNAYPRLEIDATLVYITGHSDLTSEDLALDSPYNTYKYSGLIPGPISNPSQASLSAALDPDDTTYYYYALNPATGDHKFSETWEEHDQFLESLRQNKEE